MYTLNTVEIDGYHLICSIDKAVPDPVETSRRVDTLISTTPELLTQKTRDELLLEYVVFSRLAPGQINVDDIAGERLKDIFDTLGLHERLQVSGNKVADWRGVEYWRKADGSWKTGKKEHFGETLPEDAVLPDKLSKAQQQEIAEQTEQERVANLTPEEKTREKDAAIAAAKSHIRVLREEAEIAGESFDAPAVFQTKKAEIERKFA